MEEACLSRRHASCPRANPGNETVTQPARNGILPHADYGDQSEWRGRNDLHLDRADAPASGGENARLVRALLCSLGRAMTTFRPLRPLAPGRRRRLTFPGAPVSVGPIAPRAAFIAHGRPAARDR